MLVWVLFLFSSALIHVQTVGKTIDNLQTIKDINNWYNPVAQCIFDIESELEASNKYLDDYFAVQKSCQLKVNETVDAFFTLQPKLFCNPNNGRLRDRGFFSVLPRYDDYHVKPAVNAARILTMADKRLVFLGDSTQQQNFYAFIAELQRESSITATSVLDQHRTLMQKLMGAAPWHRLDDVMDWNGLLIYMIRFKADRTSDDDIVLLQVVPTVFEYMNSGTVIIANVGHHLRYKDSISSQVVDTLGDFISWLQNLQHLKRHFIIFSETTPSHFPSSDNTYLTWNQIIDRSSIYGCVPSNLSMGNNRVENEIAEKIISSRKADIHMLETFRFFSPFYKIHFGAGVCSESDMSCKLHDEGMDCLHYCSFIPTMYIPVWHQLHDILSQHLGYIGEGKGSTTVNSTGFNSPVQTFSAATTIQQTVPDEMFTPSSNGTNGQAAAATLPYNATGHMERRDHLIHVQIVRSDDTVIDKHIIYCNGILHSLLNQQAADFVVSSFRTQSRPLPVVTIHHTVPAGVTNSTNNGERSPIPGNMTDQLTDSEEADFQTLLGSLGVVGKRFLWPLEAAVVFTGLPREYYAVRDGKKQLLSGSNLQVFKSVDSSGNLVHALYTHPIYVPQCQVELMPSKTFQSKDFLISSQIPPTTETKGQDKTSQVMAPKSSHSSTNKCKSNTDCQIGRHCTPKKRCSAFTGDE